MRAIPKTWLAVATAAITVPLLAWELAGLRADLAPAEVAPPVARSAPRLVASDLDAHAPRPETYSNIYRYDYVGPEVCEKCHTKNYEMWRSHPHSKMNRHPTATSVVGDFSGKKVDYADGSVVFSKGLGEFTATISRNAKVERQLRVTRVIGSRFVQMYMGVQSQGPEPPDDPVYTREVKIPFAYWIERREWFPETYDETPDEPEYDESGRLNAYYRYYEPAKRQWQQVCIKCHNTYPYATRFGAGSNKRLVGFPAADVALTNVAPRTRPAALSSWVDESELVTLGISCESCHFGGREHAVEGASISFLPRSQDLSFPKATESLIAGARQSAYVINSICGQCHAADPVPGPMYPNGAASWNSREARDLVAGACASEIRCTSCHNPHEAGPTRPGGPDAPKHVASCLQCHEKFRAPAAARAHSTHGDGVTCLDCHMPRFVHGLAGMVRSHRISSPSDPRMMRDDWPNACNACHLDKSTKWTLEQLASRWGKKVDLGADRKPPEDPAGPRWLHHKESVVRSVAVEAYSRSPLGRPALPELLSILEDPSPPSRMLGVLALERILGRRIGEDEYTPWASPAVRRQQVAALAQRSKE